MKALLRPLFVCGLSIAIAATSLVGSSSVAFAATRPTITDWPRTLTVTEGDTPTVQVTFSDPDGPGFYAYEVYWGDGDSNSDTISAAATGSGPWTFSVAKPTPYAAGLFRLQVSVSDGGLTNTRFGDITVLPNTAPSVISFDLTTGTEGGTSSLALTFSDPDVLDTHTVSVVWGDGSTSDPVLVPATETTFAAEHVYLDTGTYAVVLTLRDSAGHRVTASGSVSPTNVAPVLGAISFSPSSVVDHQTLTLSGSFTDPGTADTFTLTVDWGDSNTSTQPLDTARSFSATHAYNADGPVTITATVADRDNGKSNSSSVDLVVLPSNHAPSDLAVESTALLEGGSTTLSVSFTDAPLDTHTVAITWDDGSTDSVLLAAGSNSTSQPHTYLETGTYTVAVTVTDNGGMSVSGGTTVTATNVQPSLGSLVLTPSAVTDHQALTVSGTFTDPGTADTYTVLFTWGDGNTSTQSLVAGTRSFSDSHEYAAAGTYDLTVTVTDRDNGFGSQHVSVLVTARNSSATEVLDAMTGLVYGFDLDRNTERWLLKKIGDLENSLAYGNSQVCSSTGTLNHLMAFSLRTLATDQYAALSALSSKLQDAVGCASDWTQSPKVLKAATVTATTVTPTTTAASPTTSVPTQKKEPTPKTTKQESKPTAGRNR